MNRQITAGKPRGMHAYSKLSPLDENPDPAINCHRRFTGRAKGNTIFNLQEREAFLSLCDLRITLLSQGSIIKVCNKLSLYSRFSTKSKSYSSCFCVCMFRAISLIDWVLDMFRSRCIFTHCHCCIHCILICISICSGGMTNSWQCIR